MLELTLVVSTMVPLAAPLGFTRKGPSWNSSSWNDTEFLDEDVDPADLDSFNHRLSLPACRFQTIFKPNLMSGRERFASSPIPAPVFTT